MRIVEGDRFKDKSTGHLYEVKRINDGTVVLEAEDPPNRVWLREGSVKLFFEMVEKKRK